MKNLYVRLIYKLICDNRFVKDVNPEIDACKLIPGCRKQRFRDKLARMN